MLKALETFSNYLFIILSLGSCC